MESSKRVPILIIQSISNILDTGDTLVVHAKYQIPLSNACPGGRRAFDNTPDLQVARTTWLELDTYALSWRRVYGPWEGYGATDHGD